LPDNDFNTNVTKQMLTIIQSMHTFAKIHKYLFLSAKICYILKQYGGLFIVVLTKEKLSALQYPNQRNDK